MSVPHRSAPPPLSAVQRTELLHRMLIARHLAERHAAAPVDFHVGEEAAVVGVLSALGPYDAVLPDAGLARAVELARADLRAHRDAVTVCLFDAEAGDAADRLDVARRAGLPMLFCRRARSGPAAGSEPLPADTVDALDVEAVLPGARASLHAVRCGAGPRLLGLCATGGTAHPDPIELLVVRMYAAHQLDDNALRAIDADAAARTAGV
jgi:hypothetical protein